MIIDISLTPDDYETVITTLENAMDEIAALSDELGNEIDSNPMIRHLENVLAILDDGIVV